MAGWYYWRGHVSVDSGDENSWRPRNRYNLLYRKKKYIKKNSHLKIIAIIIHKYEQSTKSSQCILRNHLPQRSNVLRLACASGAVWWGSSLFAIPFVSFRYSIEKSVRVWLRIMGLMFSSHWRLDFCLNWFFTAQSLHCYRCKNIWKGHTTVRLYFMCLSNWKHNVALMVSFLKLKKQTNIT